jgi:hypothetical protein
MSSKQPSGWFFVYVNWCSKCQLAVDKKFPRCPFCGGCVRRRSKKNPPHELERLYALSNIGASEEKKVHSVSSRPGKPKTSPDFRVFSKGD